MPFFIKDVKFMVFSSIPFLYLFLPAVILVYFLVPRVLKNSILLISGLIFYAWGEPKYIFLMCSAILLNYICGLIIDRYRDKAISKVAVITAVSADIGMLLFFKYADFFIENFNAVSGMSIPFLKIALPVGISFYTFQILSYTIDVYKGETEAQKNIISLGAYIVMFPQLVAGPIVRYSDINNALSERTHTLQIASEGVRRFVTGLSKKVLIADSLGNLCETFRISDDKSVLFYWIYAISFSLQIYFDFSGYSDMAIGLGKIFGFRFIENFDYPYISRSVTEFWRRWHRSLGQWFRDYVYIPLGGNRTSKIKHLRNILAVWLLTGFWHGAQWNFIVWGLYFGILLIAEKFLLLKHLEKSSILSRIYLLFIVIISFVIFNAVSLKEASDYICAMFGIGTDNIISDEAVYYLRSYAVTFIIAVIGSTPLPRKLYEKYSEKTAVAVAEPIITAILLIVSTAYLVDSSFSPFLYFRF